MKFIPTKRTDLPAKTPKEPKPNCIVFYAATADRKREAADKYIENPPGNPHKVKDKFGTTHLLYLLKCQNGTEEAFEPLTASVMHDPWKVGRARKLPHALSVFRPSRQLIEKVALWALVAAVGIGGYLVIILLGELDDIQQGAALLMGVM